MCHIYPQFFATTFRFQLTITGKFLSPVKPFLSITTTTNNTQNQHCKRSQQFQSIIRECNILQHAIVGSNAFLRMDFPFWHNARIISPNYAKRRTFENANEFCYCRFLRSVMHYDRLTRMSFRFALQITHYSAHDYTHPLVEFHLHWNTVPFFRYLFTL